MSDVVKRRLSYAVIAFYALISWPYFVYEAPGRTTLLAGDWSWLYVAMVTFLVVGTAGGWWQVASRRWGGRVLVMPWSTQRTSMWRSVTDLVMIPSVAVALIAARYGGIGLWLLIGGLILATFVEIRLIYWRWRLRVAEHTLAEVQSRYTEATHSGMVIDASASETSRTMVDDGGEVSS